MMHVNGGGDRGWPSRQSLVWSCQGQESFHQGPSLINPYPQGGDDQQEVGTHGDDRSMNLQFLTGSPWADYLKAVQKASGTWKWWHLVSKVANTVEVLCGCIHIAQKCPYDWDPQEFSCPPVTFQMLLQLAVVSRRTWHASSHLVFERKYFMSTFFSCLQGGHEKKNRGSDNSLNSAQGHRGRDLQASEVWRPNKANQGQ